MRLIDADRLIEILNGWWFKVRPSTYEPKEVKAVLKITANVIENCIDIVNDRPTAYDIDKVVEQLEGEIELVVKDYPLQGRYIKKSRAIEIVKADQEEGAE